MDQKYSSWKTTAFLLYIHKVPELVHMSQGIKKDQQASYELNPGMHGSNGSYVENPTYYWSLVLKARSIGPEVPKPEFIEIDIDTYMKQRLMPRLGWHNISGKRNEAMNDALKAYPKLPIITYDMDKYPIYRQFTPIESSWEELLDQIFSCLK